MADVGTRLWLLPVTLGLLALLTGGTSAEKDNTRNNTGDRCPPVHQNPRYVAIRKNMPVHFICYSQEPQTMKWYKTAEDRNDFSVLDQSTPSYSIERTNSSINLTLFRATYEDNGIYVCDRKDLEKKEELHSCGTELRVMGTSSIKQVQNRNTLKDAIIIIQSILLIIFISIPILIFLDKGEEKKSPEEDHTYEGLEVEQMATYEDITPFRDVKAKWTVGEHPGEE
ncbi:B-cell antigen receptor complex-associated protein beta chain [Corvus cornix cornix]|uniref:B-cell antigen receptor complex-associated protein beta chain n=1 Tax=Corvus brachyrhynchos TaxID=85066 RepID=UPI0004DE0863|nr:PREDICTED: B-cell antigen receptor complex-associated protein beta chain [Corvus brachyrhynchos]XP_039421878.1 B-cell antigen receptor complex-associated protein beta chain [Corvus cornix cornix]XP_041877053.1 B-cell antigen receptor complex-associated protein beta chain [Corvus kubaryi]XP_048170601.1 B-cell antigen receptor complex-associated protein beta chain [Corvus hawaiiensis]